MFSFRAFLSKIFCKGRLPIADINGYITDVENFNATLNDTLASVVGYVEQGSGAIQLFLTGVPLVSAFLLFFVVFAVVRKVVGR